MRILARLLTATLLVGFMSHETTMASAEKNMTVFKTPWCGCCKSWTEAIKKAGYTVEVLDVQDLSLVKKQASVPDALVGCHTAVLGKYVFEGHVPLQAIDKLLKTQPAVRGIAVPGMPSGSLGMGNDPDARYDVMAFTYTKTDKPTVFYQVGQ